MESEKWAEGGGGGAVMERQRWETEGRKRGGRYSHVINDKWWQSVGGGGSAGRLHGSLPAERLLLGGAGGRGKGGEVEEEEEDTPGTLSDLLLSLQEQETSLLNGRKLCEDKSIFSAPQIWFV